MRGLTPDMRVYIWDHQDPIHDWVNWDKKWLVMMIKHYTYRSRDRYRESGRPLLADERDDLRPQAGAYASV